jgi:hypothetical protein
VSTRIDAEVTVGGGSSGRVFSIDAEPEFERTTSAHLGFLIG